MPGGRRAFLRGALLGTLAVTAVLVPVQPARGAFKYLKAGMEAPDFALTTWDGERIGCEALKEKRATLVLFWATWSLRSRQALLDAQALQGHYGEEGFEVVAVNVDRSELGFQDRSRIEAMVEDLGLTLDLALDPGLTVSGSFGVVANPSLALFDGEGRLAWDASGYFGETAAACRERVEILLGRRGETPSFESESPAAPKPPVRKALLYYNLGCSLLRQGQRSRALDTLESAAEADETFAAPQVLLGHLLLEEGRAASLIRAEKCFRRAVEADPRGVSARSGLGESLLRQGRVEEALEELEEATALDRAFTPALLSLARACSLKGDLERAGRLFAEALELSPRDPVVFASRGEAGEKAGDLAAAASDYRRSLEILLELQ